MSTLSQPPAGDAGDLAELLRLVPRPIPWEDFKRHVLPVFSAEFVSKQHGKKVRRIISELEALDLATEGEPPRGIASTADLSIELVGRYLASRPPDESPHTTKERLMIVQRLANLAVQFRWLEVSPFAVRPIRHLVRCGDPQDERHLSREELCRLFEVLRADVASKKGWALWRARRLLAAVSIATYTGLRRNELLLLQVDDLDVDSRVIRLVPRSPRGKGLKSAGSAKPVGIPTALIPIIRDWLAHRLDAPRGYPIDAGCPWVIPNCRRTRPWLSGSTKKGTSPLGRLQAAGRRAGIPDVTWQVLRRSLATLMEFAGAGEAMIQRQLRHSSASVSRRFYRKADEANIAEAMKDVSFE